MPDRDVAVVIEVEVLHREHPERAHERRIEQAPLLVARLQLLEPLDDLGQPVDAVDQHAMDPAAVVQPEVVGVHPLPGLPQELRHASLHRHRPVADADRAHARVIVQGLHHDPHRVREVDQERLRRDLLDQPAVADHRRDRPKRHREPAGSGRLLAEHAVFERHLLVDRSRRSCPGRIAAKTNRAPSIAARASGSPRTVNGAPHS